MMAGPEVSRLVAGYEAISCVKDAVISSKHHEQNLSTQSVLKEMGKPFQEESDDPLVLDTKNIADPALAELVGTHHERGKEQFRLFVEGLENADTNSF